jgi:anti-sigma-K factor RskA
MRRWRPAVFGVVLAIVAFLLVACAVLFTPVRQASPLVCVGVALMTAAVCCLLFLVLSGWERDKDRLE